MQSSEYAEILGLPVPVLGLIGYLGILATTFVAGETARLVGAALALGGLAFSIYLLVVQIVAIGALCQWCLASDVVMLPLTVAAVARLRRPATG